MKNPKTWAGATPYNHSGKVDHSSSGRSEGASSNSRGHAHPTKSWKGATSMGYSKPTADSEALDPIPGSTNTHPLLQVKESTASPAYGPGASMIGAPKTGAKTFGADPKESMPKPWHKRNYDMTAPSTEGSGKARKKP